MTDKLLFITENLTVQIKIFIKKVKRSSKPNLFSQISWIRKWLFQQVCKMKSQVFENEHTTYLVFCIFGFFLLLMTHKFIFFCCEKWLVAYFWRNRFWCSWSRCPTSHAYVPRAEIVLGGGHRVLQMLDIRWSVKCRRLMNITISLPLTFPCENKFRFLWL